MHPEGKLRGIVKLVVKTPWSKVECTAVQFPTDVFAFYNRTGSMIGYQWKNCIFDDRNTRVMEIRKQPDKNNVNEQYVILDNQPSVVAIISKGVSCTYIYTELRHGLEKGI